MADRYYRERLAAVNLEYCYQLATPRILRYLRAELGHVLSFVDSGDRVLDLGCGYGRVIPDLLQKVGKSGLVVGIDSSRPSIEMARSRLAGEWNPIGLAVMDAGSLGIAAVQFDAVICIQNGISAFHVDQRKLIGDALQVTRPGGTVFFSSYCEAFWLHRLDWFRRQVAAGLLGIIDEEKTGNGVIVCRDGFRATTVGPERFRELTAGLPADVFIEEVDGSSLFCRMEKTGSLA